MANLQDSLSRIIRHIEADLGTSALTDLSLSNIIDAVNNFEYRSLEDFYEQFKELMALMKTTKPRIGVLIFHFCELWEEMSDQKQGIASKEDLYNVMESAIVMMQNNNRSDAAKLVNEGLDCIQDGDSILIHNHSRSVLNLLIEARRKKKKFKVVLAEQEAEKTHDMVKTLQAGEVPFVTVPEFMLSHLEKEVNKVFLGALTFNNTYNFVTDAGTNSLVAEFHHAKVPIYLFMTSRKFSLWDTKESQQTHKVTQKHCGCHPEDMLTYDRVKFSHDRLPLDLVDKVITEEGVFSPKEIKELFDKRYKDYALWRKKYI